MTVSRRELEAEQAYFDNAAEHRERRRERALDPDAGLAGIHPAAAAQIREANLARASAMGAPGSAVAFRRITEESGENFYIGYFPILDEGYEPLVISWKTDKAAVFNEARREQRLGLTAKRVYQTDGNSIVDIVDDLLTEEGPETSAIVSRDAILRSLAERRDGRLSDIVTTIEKAQDEVMRAPSSGLLIVQGGPGTGKTVIGLQRLSVIAYRDRLERDQLLFVGPSGGFLQYISNVIPTLGDEGMNQMAIASLAPLRPRHLRLESTVAARLKGDARMAKLLVRAISDRHNKPTGDVTIDIDGQAIALEASDLSEAVESAEALKRPHNVSREALREYLIRLIVDKSDPSVRRTAITEATVRSSVDFNNFLDRTWQTYSPQEFLRDLLGSERRLQTHARGIFAGDEILDIGRPPQARISDEPWTAADLALLDEIEVLLNGSASVPSYDHIVVDEAQDLSPMQLRAIGRRRGGGMTVLGDLAQATGPWAHRSWEEVVTALGETTDARVVELEIGYRVPREVMRVAKAIARSLDLTVKLPEPIRESGIEPRFVPADEGRSIRTAISETRVHLEAGRSVGLVAADESIDEVKAALRYEGLEFGEAEDTTLRPITLVRPAASKGLEFDAVVLMEPSEIAHRPTGLGELFVAITRTTGALSIVYDAIVPDELREFLPESPPTRTPRAAPTRDQEEQPGGPAAATPYGAKPGEETAASTPQSMDLTESVIDALVEQVARSVSSTLQPQAVEKFILRLTEALAPSEGHKNPLAQDEPPRGVRLEE